VDFFHFFNHVSPGTRPRLCSFETIVPRVSEAFDLLDGRALTLEQQRALDKLTRLVEGRSCVRRLAVSDATALLQRHFSSRLASLGSAMLAKTDVLQPPQPLMPMAERPTEAGPLRLAIVGHDFSRKGCVELPHAVKNVTRRHGRVLHLTVVSALGTSVSAAPHTAVDVQNTRPRLGSMSEYETYFPSLTPLQVAELIQRTDLGFLSPNTEMRPPAYFG
jgi:hypothetical protein